MVCLQGEDYQKRAEKVQAALDAETEGNANGLPTPPGSATDSSSASISPSSIATKEQLLPSLSSGLQYGQRSFVSTATLTSTVPPRGMGGSMSLGMKGSKRYRSISGKMAAIKSLGDKGLITADDRGHLKDLLLNDDSPQLQEALENYNSTGDFQAVKAILMKELSNPSSKRNAAGEEWISVKLIDDINRNFVRILLPVVSCCVI